MAVGKPMPRVSRSQGANRPKAVSKHAKDLSDIRITSQKQALQHTVRAKKLDERQLFKFLKSLDDNKNRRLLQIDKEVAEVEKLLRRLSSEQENARLQHERRLSSGEDLTEYERDDGHGGAKSAPVPRRRQAAARKMTKQFDEFAFRARQKRASIDRLDKDKADKLLNAYYRFDSSGNRRVVSPLISSASHATPRPTARVAWDSDFFPEDISVSNFTLASETDSRIDSATNKSLPSTSDEVFDDDFARNDTITPSRAIFMTSGKFSSQSSRRTPKSQPHAGRTTPRGSKAIKTPRKMPKSRDGKTSSTSSEPNSKKSQMTLNRDDRKLSQTDKETVKGDKSTSSISKTKAKIPVVQVTEEDDNELSFKRSKLKLKRRPIKSGASSEDGEATTRLTTKNESDDELERNTNINMCVDETCQIPDCIFHQPRKQMRHPSIDDSNAVIGEYYRIKSASHSRMTGKPVVSPVFQSPDERTWQVARRVPVAPPSPTPSEILEGVVTEREVVVDKPDYTDLEVMSSVRRPTKGSNRDRMLKDKEENIVNTFKIMRQKMAAGVPPEFNTNYGTPTPNWKILNPLKLRHKVAHTSPLYTLWKLN